VRGPGRLALSGVLGAALVAALALLLAGCDQGPQGRRERSLQAVIAEVNGEPITLGELYAMLMVERKISLPARGTREALRILVEQLVERRLMIQRFRESGDFVDETQVRRYVETIASQYGPEGLGEVLREEGIERDNWVQAVRETLEIELLLEREVYSKVKVSEEEVEAHYARNRERYRVGKRWRVRQIVTKSEEEALRLRGQILGGASFDLIAREKSIAPERAGGGDLGFFEPGELPESIESVIKYLEEGHVSRVVRSSSGYHLLQVTERRSAGVQPLDAVRREIEAELLAEKGRKRVREWLSALRAKASIRYYWRNLDHGLAG